MNDLATQVRIVIDGATKPVSADEIIAVANRDPTPEHQPNRERDLRPRAIAVAIAGAVAAAVVTAVVASDLGGSHTPTAQSARRANETARAVLIHEATLAAAQAPLLPSPGQWLYVQTTSGSITGAGSTTGHWNYYVQEFTQQWTSPSGTNSSLTFATGQPQFLTAADQAAWQTSGNPPIEIGQGGSPPAVYYDVADLPTDPSQMATYFAAQIQLPGASDPSPATQFDVAVGFLSHGASSAQRAALFQYMATLPGVKNLGVTQAVGSRKSGVTLAVLGTQGRQVEAVIDTSTTEILEERVIVANPAQLNAGLPGLYPSSMEAGQALDYIDFDVAGIAESSSSAPSGVPIPAPWPPNTARSPLPNVAFPAGYVGPVR